MSKKTKKIDLSKMTREELEIKYIEEIEAKNSEIEELKEKLRLFTAEKFGKSSEKSKPEEDDNQITFFDEAEAIAFESGEFTEPKLEQVVTPKKDKKKKQKGHKERTVKNLPKETIEYTLTEEEQTCKTCNSKLEYMKKTIRNEIVVIPAKVKVVKHITNVYTCRHCQSTGEGNPIYNAPSPKPVFRNSLASSSILALIIRGKYANHIPLYRAEQEFLELSLKLSRETISNWVLNTAESYLKIIYQAMWEDLLSKEILHVDETTLQVLNEEGKEDGPRNGYIWTYTTGHGDIPIALYQYANTRSKEIPKKSLEHFKGFVHVDGYAGYNVLDGMGITRVICFAHARRKYSEALKALPKETKDIESTIAFQGQEYMNKLFDLDRKCKDSSLEIAEKIKREQVKPLLEEYFSWTKENEPKMIRGLSKKALQYSINLEKVLTNYLLDPRLEASNNKAERAVKPFVIGRKNFMFCNTKRGADGSAILYSIVQTASQNNIKIYEYLDYVIHTLSQLTKVTNEDVEKLLPYSEGIKEQFSLIEE